MYKSFFVALLISYTCWVYADSPYKIETISIYHRPAQELVPILQPLLTESGTVQAYNNSLIIKAPSNQMEAIKAVIEKLDTKTSRLMVSISQGADKPSEHFKISEDGQVHYDQKSYSNIKKRFHQTSREDNRSIHHLSLNSGETAYIQSGVSIPIVIYEDAYRRDWQAFNSTQAQSNAQSNRLEAEVPVTNPAQINPVPNQQPLSTPNLILAVPPVTNALINVNPTAGAEVEVDLRQSQQSSQFDSLSGGDGQAQGAARHTIQHELQSGIYIQPTLTQDEVRLYVQSIEERPSKQANQNAARDKPSYSTQRMETTIQVPLGEWIYLGGNQKETEIQQGWQFGTKDRSLQRTHIWVRVDKID